MRKKPRLNIDPDSDSAVRPSKHFYIWNLIQTQSSSPEILQQPPSPLTSTYRFPFNILQRKSWDGNMDGLRVQTPVSRSPHVWGWLLRTPGSIATAGDYCDTIDRQQATSSLLQADMVSEKQGECTWFYVQLSLEISCCYFQSNLFCVFFL